MVHTMIMPSPSLVRSYPIMQAYSLTHHTASKCDDVSCTEVINALDLSDNPELEKIEEQIDQCKEDTVKWRKKKAEAEASIKGQ